MQKSNKLNLHSSLFFHVQLAKQMAAMYVAGICYVKAISAMLKQYLLCYKGNCYVHSRYKTRVAGPQVHVDQAYYGPRPRWF